MWRGRLPNESKPMNDSPDTVQRPAQPDVATGPLLAVLDRLIANVGNRSFDCGEWTRDSQGEQYDTVLDKSLAAKAELRRFVVPFVAALADIVKGEEGDKAHRAVAVARRALSSANVGGEPTLTQKKEKQ